MRPVFYVYIPGAAGQTAALRLYNRSGRLVKSVETITDGKVGTGARLLADAKQWAKANRYSIVGPYLGQ